MRRLFSCGLLKGIFNFLTAINRRNQNEQGSASDNQTQGSSGLVPIIVWQARQIAVFLGRHPQLRYAPLMVSLTSSSTRFIS